MRTIEMVNCDKEFLSIEKFMALSDSEKSNIKTVKIIPPRLDGNDFGKILVKYKVPSYKVAGLG